MQTVVERFSRYRTRQRPELERGRSTTSNELSSWIERRAIDRDGETIGVVVDVYDDPVSHRPAWIAIGTGFFGTRVGIVPVESVSPLGDDLVIAHDRARIATSPIVDVCVAVNPQDHDRLTNHYRHHPSADHGRPFTTNTTN